MDPNNDSNNDINEPTKQPKTIAEKYWWLVVIAVLGVIGFISFVVGTEYAYRQRRARISSVSLEGASSPKEWMVSMIKGARTGRSSPRR